MRVIYLVRAAQLLMTIRALFMLYSVSKFCETTHLTMNECSTMFERIPLATPEQIAEFQRFKQQQRAAADTTSDASTTTATAPVTTEKSTVSPSTTEEAKKRQKREERRELPGNGMSEAQRKAAAAATETKKEEGKKEGEQKQASGVKTEAKSDAKKEEKEEEAVTASAPAHHEEKKTDQKSQLPEAKDAKVEVKTEEKKEGEQKSGSGVNSEAKVEEKKSEEKKKPKPSVEKKEELAQATTEASKDKKKEKKEYLGAKIDIPVASDAHHHDQKQTEGKVDSAPSSSSSEDKHHTVKKDLKAHVQEPVQIEHKKKELPPKLSPVHEKFVAGHSSAFLHKHRCVKVTWDDYLGKQASPYAQHLKGLVLVGPVLVAICVYLVCTVLQASLMAEAPSKFTEALGCFFHAALWAVVIQTLAVIYEHWALNWYGTSDASFKPEFPCEWTALMILSGIMFVAAAIETGYQATSNRLHYDIVFERSYRCYEVIDNDAMPNAAHLSRTNVY